MLYGCMMKQYYLHRYSHECNEVCTHILQIQRGKDRQFRFRGWNDTWVAYKLVAIDHCIESTPSRVVALNVYMDVAESTLLCVMAIWFHLAVNAKL